MDYDVIIAGGSIAGLVCAREIAKNGHSVLVLEEDYEIGTPEHCGGLVSATALEDLGIVPRIKTFEHVIEKADIASPNGEKFTVNSKKQKVVEINRRELDKQIAHQAQKNGAEIRVRTSVQEFTKSGIRTKDKEIKCKIIVDARGVASLIHKDRTGIIPSAQYEIYAKWIKKDIVKIYFDQEKYPGFFAWIIPSAHGIGKVGVAGRKINTATVLEEFLKTKGEYSTIRKIFAPIWIKGPIDDFLQGDNIVIIGDAAGQAKPTTAGGIYTCGMGGIFAGQAISKFLETGDRKELKEYQKRWSNKFKKEFDRQLLARKILERLENKTIDKLFGLVTPQITQEISENDDFDFHTDAIIRILGVKGTIKATKTILSDELKKILDI
jgi:geranylgeranyl reductase family protein